MIEPMMPRRQFLKSAATAYGALVVGVHVPALARGATNHDGPLKPNAWLVIHPNNQINFILDKVEMGQGVTTALPVIVAEELNVKPEQLMVEFAPADRDYVNPAMGLQITGGSTSVSTTFLPLREAGASTRQLLEASAARVWKVAPQDCQGKDGVISGPSGRSMTYGDASRHAEGLSALEPRLKPRSQWRFIGKTMQRLDAAAKTKGQATFGIDVQPPGLVIAVLVRCPHPGGYAKGFKETMPRPPAIKNILMLPCGVAVLGETYAICRTVADSLEVVWSEGPNSKFSSKQLRDHYLTLAKDSGAGKILREEGEKPSAELGTETMQATYEVPFLAHATMEPQNCTAHVTKNRCDVWAPTQSVGQAQQVAAELTGLNHDQVFVHGTFLGGGFGRRLAQDYVAEAVQVAKNVSYPVKVVWSREDDMRHSLYRPMAVHSLSAVIDNRQQPKSWHHRVVSQSILNQNLGEIFRTIAPSWLPEWMKQGLGSAVVGTQTFFDVDPSTAEGAKEVPYGIPHLRVDAVTKNNDYPVGFLRSVGHSHTAFAVESFIDELANIANEDPAAFRRKLLQDQKRHLGVLDLLTEKSGWNQPLPKGTFRGIALHESFGSVVGLALRIRLTKDQHIKLVSADFAVDCGQVVQPDIVAMQMESSFVYGASAALFGEISMTNGAVEQSNFHDYQMLRMQHMPVIQTHIVTSNAPPTGVGEPGVPVVAPALANALRAATGIQHRTLPLTVTMAD